jgi:hypothetical protein
MKELLTLFRIFLITLILSSPCFASYDDTRGYVYPTQYWVSKTYGYYYFDYSPSYISDFKTAWVSSKENGHIRTVLTANNLKNLLTEALKRNKTYSGYEAGSSLPLSEKDYNLNSIKRIWIYAAGNIYSSNTVSSIKIYNGTSNNDPVLAEEIFYKPGGQAGGCTLFIENININGSIVTGDVISCQGNSYFGYTFKPLGKMRLDNKLFESYTDGSGFPNVLSLLAFDLKKSSIEGKITAVNSQNEIIKSVKPGSKVSIKWGATDGTIPLSDL